jgi:hypothetical protein
MGGAGPRAVEMMGPIWQTNRLMTMRPPEDPNASQPAPEAASAGVTGQPAASDGPTRPPSPALPREIGGRDGPEPTRFGDWEKAGRCIDF